MYILPNTKIRLIKNCPLDKSQENTIYFTSEAAQQTYFLTTLNGFLFEQNTYQRVNKNSLRVQMNAEALYNCNYLAFQNTSFGSKWFYAFIDKIEYINNVTSEVTYTLDVMQTWHFQYELEQCFVEREHSVTDAIGANIVDEKLDTGEYIYDYYDEPIDISKNKGAPWSVAMFSTMYYDEDDQEYKKVYGYYGNDVVSGLKPVFFANTYNGSQDLINWVRDLPLFVSDTFVSGVIVPDIMKDNTSPATGNRELLFPVQKTLMRSDGTPVKNNKCLTFPYCFIYATNYQGKSATYKYEYFTHTSTVDNKEYVRFILLGEVSPNPILYIAPTYYKLPYGSPLNLLTNDDEALELTGFPQVSWNIDAFKAWVAQNASSVTIAGLAASYASANAFEGAISGGGAHLAKTGVHSVGGASELGSNVVGGIATAALVYNCLNGLTKLVMPPQSRGNMSGTSQYSSGRMTFGFMNKHITPEFATIIDDYFTMFGYATNKVKVPNRIARPEWNYVKTIGCKINGINAGNGGLPADDADEIESIYNKGVRFWTNPAHIGDYSYNNAPSV